LACPDTCITSALRIAMQLYREYASKVEVHCIRFSGPCTHICLRRAYSKKDTFMPVCVTTSTCVAFGNSRELGFKELTYKKRCSL
jgi:hypothetical protein